MELETTLEAGLEAGFEIGAGLEIALAMHCKYSLQLITVVRRASKFVD